MRSDEKGDWLTDILSPRDQEGTEGAEGNGSQRARYALSIGNRGSTQEMGFAFLSLVL